MRDVVFGLAVFTLVTWSVGCADVESDEDPNSKFITVACATSSPSNQTTLHGWELTIEPSRIEAGKTFTAVLGGTAVFSEAFLDWWSGFFDLKEGHIHDLHATVVVRSGATGNPVTLTPDLPYHCLEDRATCDPANDVSPNDGTGRRANTDCEPVEVSNPCAPLVTFPRSDDCTPGGPCDARGKIGAGSPCASQGYCITGNLEVKLKATGDYVADDDTTAVLFGWDDEGTGATRISDLFGNEVWALPAASFATPAGTMGIRMNLHARDPSLGVFGVAFECAMGVDSQDSNGRGPLVRGASPTPADMLLAIPLSP